MNHVHVNLGDRSYPIYIQQNLLSSFAERLSLSVRSKKAFIVTDSNIESIYLETAKKNLIDHGFCVFSFVIKAGEESKTLQTANDILSFFFQNNGDRTSFFIALGGGVVGDLTGFCASLALRGVDFIQIPTTFLSQVDSSVGGKTGVNASFGKNLIGTFCQPKAVFIDPTTLKTLPKIQLLSGFAEVIKYGLIKDVAFFDFLVKNANRILELDIEALTKAILRSIQIKADIVAKDEMETSDLRALLNFGHTFGHAFEAKSGMDGSLPHGLAVAIGMICATKLSVDMNLCSLNTLNKITSFFQSIGLPVTYSKTYDTMELVELMFSDKKTTNAELNLVLLNNIGNASLIKNVNKTHVLDALAFGKEQ